MQKTYQRPESVLKSLISLQVLIGFLGMAVFYATIANPEESVLTGKALEQPADDSAEVLRQAASLKPARLADAGKMSEAMLSVDQLLDEQPHDLPLTVCRAKIYMKAGRSEDAFRSYKRALALAPRNRFIRIDYARALAASDRKEAAISQYRLLEKQCPSLPDPRFELAQLYMLNNNPVEATAEFAEVIRLRPNFATAYKLRGINMARAGRAEEGMQEYMNGINVENRGGQPEALKVILSVWGNIEKAKYDLERQASANPNDPTLKVRLAHLNLYINKTEEAKQYLQDARRLTPNNPEIHRLLCVVYQKIGDHRQAVTEFMQSVALEKALEERNKTPAVKS